MLLRAAPFSVVFKTDNKSIVRRQSLISSWWQQIFRFAKNKKRRNHFLLCFSALIYVIPLVHFSNRVIEGLRKLAVKQLQPLYVNCRRVPEKGHSAGTKNNVKAATVAAFTLSVMPMVQISNRIVDDLEVLAG